MELSIYSHGMFSLDEGNLKY